MSGLKILGRMNLLIKLTDENNIITCRISQILAKNDAGQTDAPTLGSVPRMLVALGFQAREMTEAHTARQMQRES